ncbi:MAG TPA: YutD family protein [Tenericutes bacterium]|nr:YutD family protein [Mycoplasmatota bacterium]
MKKIIINEKNYELIRNYKEGFDLEEVKSKMTDYFDTYDYIFGDWAYGKLRLKGFCDKSNKQYRKINAIESLDDYIKNNCAYDCKYFLLKKNGN